MPLWEFFAITTCLCNGWKKSEDPSSALSLFSLIKQVSMSPDSINILTDTALLFSLEGSQPFSLEASIPKARDLFNLWNSRRTQSQNILDKEATFWIQLARNRSSANWMCFSFCCCQITFTFCTGLDLLSQPVLFAIIFMVRLKGKKNHIYWPLFWRFCFSWAVGFF